ncbi:MAG: LTA synthase family protein [Alphaproteobacteria bacterium]|nr:LTA synthase family protein [Alphaproteobacteria bacterium]
MLKIKQLFFDTALTILLGSAIFILLAMIRTNLIWGNVYIEQILANATDTDNSIAREVMRGYVLFAFIPAIITAAILAGCLKKTRYIVLIILLCITYPIYKLQLVQYIINQNTYSDIYAQEYLNPQNSTYIFPEHKRNLIILHMESLESEYENPTLVGKNLLPNLSRMADENIFFSNFHQLDGQDYTIAAMVASYCGVPYKLFNNKDFTTFNNFLPRLTCYPQILEQNGYDTYFMKGAPLDFTQTGTFFSSHGFNDVVGTYELESRFGLNLKQQQGNSWGFRDSALYALAKQRLPEIASKGKPFIFAMLTVDTHAPDFYIDKQCRQTGNSQLDAAACADVMAADFINWLKEQDFYKNTTVVVMGDHTKTGGNDLYPQFSDRHIFNMIINPAITKKTNNQAWTTVDLPATILEALGIQFGGQFGLGYSLFADKPTLYAKYGNNFDTELKKMAAEYNEFNRTRYTFTPLYNQYSPYGKNITEPLEIKKYASFSDISFGSIWLDTLSLSLPETTSLKLNIDISFKLIFVEGGERTIQVFANGKLLEEWLIHDYTEQPIERRITIPTALLNNGKLLLEFKSDAVGFTAAGVGIGVNKFSITED